MNRVEYLREWRKRNPEKEAIYLERTKERQKRNRKKISAREKEYRRKHPEKIKIWNQTYLQRLRKERPWAYWHKQVKARCRNKLLYYRKVGIKYLLSVEEMKELWFRDKAYNLSKPSIDRINTVGDYTFDNCRFIEHTENMRRKKGVYHPN